MLPTIPIKDETCQQKGISLEARMSKKLGQSKIAQAKTNEWCTSCYIMLHPIVWSIYMFYLSMLYSDYID